MSQSGRSRAAVRWVIWLPFVATAWLAMPSPAAAHGPANPAASRWQARVTSAPAGLHARTIDGDLRLWLSVAPTTTAEVIDYRGAPYLRFAAGGVFVNRNSAMWYVNHVPRLTPPISLGPHSRVAWERVSSGHSYLWQDGRLQALSRTVLASGSDDAGRWAIPVTVDGRRTTITGRLYRWPDPSPVWLWPIVVALACTLAGLRLRRPALERRMATALGMLAIAGVALSSVGRQLHGRPTVSAGQLVMLGFELVYCLWALGWLARGRAGWLTFFLLAMVALWQGVSLVATLFEGDVLLVTGPLLGRLGDIACLSAGVALVPIALVMVERDLPRRRHGPASPDDGDHAQDDPTSSPLTTPSTWDPTT